jgi:hypothetical protein
MKGRERERGGGDREGRGWDGVEMIVMAHT